MSIGKNYKEALQKAIRSLEIGRHGLGFAKNFNKLSLDQLMGMLTYPTSERQFVMYEALRKGADIDALFEKTRIKHWFIQQMAELVALEEQILQYKGKTLPDKLLIQAKKDGFADKYLAKLLGVPEAADPQPPDRAGPGRGLGRGPGQRRGECGLLLLDLQRSGQGPRQQPAQDHGPRRRSQPHRPGHRVRLLLRPRGLHAPRRGLRIHHGQLQPRDRLHRLRHLGQALLRAADGRGRPEHLREGEARGRDRPVRRADPAEPRQRAGPGGRQDHRDLARGHRPGRGPRPLPRGDPQDGDSAAGVRHGRQPGGGHRDRRTRSAIR